MVSAQRHLPGALPSPPRLYPKPRRFSPQCLGRFGDRSPARRLLSWMLLGVDDIVVRWWRDERVMDHGHCHACIRGESHRRTPCLACCGRRSHLRRYLAADAIGYVRYGLTDLVHHCISGTATTLADVPEVGKLLTSVVARADEIFAQSAIHLPAPALAAARTLHVGILH